jgi:hypothetical protein
VTAGPKLNFPKQHAARPGFRSGYADVVVNVWHAHATLAEARIASAYRSSDLKIQSINFSGAIDFLDVRARPLLAGFGQNAEP